MAPKVFRTLALGLLGRRLLTELTGLRVALEQHNLLLARLADQFAPQMPEAHPDNLRRVGSVDHVDDIELGLIEDFSQRTRENLHREPTEEEILRYLAEEKTGELQYRLSTAAQARRMR